LGDSFRPVTCDGNGQLEGEAPGSSLFHSK
jgi:hypothetical protein